MTVSFHSFEEDELNGEKGSKDRRNCTSELVRYAGSSRLLVRVERYCYCCSYFLRRSTLLLLMLVAHFSLPFSYIQMLLPVLLYLSSSSLRYKALHPQVSCHARSSSPSPNQGPLIPWSRFERDAARPVYFL